jgi:hypothetical protein
MIAFVLVASGGVAYADGTLAMRGVWYKEKGTRVEQPMVDAVFDAGDEAQVDAHVLVDAITSASSASGGGGDTAFSERRWEAGGGYTHQLGDNTSGNLHGKISREPDYLSVWAGTMISRSLAQKNFNVTLTVDAGYDDVGMLRVGLGGALSRASVGHLYNGISSLSISQILSKNMVLGLSYDIAYLSGYQQNPYRTAITADGLVPERHPDTRIRHAWAATVRDFLPRTRTTLIAAYRLYTDTWGLLAHTPELRVVQDVGDDVDFTVRLRYYRQKGASFFLPSYPSSDPMRFPYVTDDVKLSDFSETTIGVKFGAMGRVFGLTGRWEDARGEIVMECAARNNRFGNAVSAHAALIVPFLY